MLDLLIFPRLIGAIFAALFESYELFTRINITKVQFFPLIFSLFSCSCIKTGGFAGNTTGNSPSGAAPVGGKHRDGGVKIAPGFAAVIANSSPFHP